MSQYYGLMVTTATIVCGIVAAFIMAKVAERQDRRRKEKRQTKA